MRLKYLPVQVLSLLALVPACSDDTHVDAEEIAAYRELTVQVEERTRSYRADMADPDLTQAECMQLQDAYDSDVRGWLDRMFDRSRSMNGFMGRHRGGDESDIECMAASMMYELDHHASLACSYDDMDTARNEAAAFTDAMLGYADHVEQRCNEMLDGFDEERWSWRPMMEGCESWDGHCSGMMDACGDGGYFGGGMHGGGMHHDGY